MDMIHFSMQFCAHCSINSFYGVENISIAADEKKIYFSNFSIEKYFDTLVFRSMSKKVNLLKIVKTVFTYSHKSLIV